MLELEGILKYLSGLRYFRGGEFVWGIIGCKIKRFLIYKGRWIFIILELFCD